MDCDIIGQFCIGCAQFYGVAPFCGLVLGEKQIAATVGYIELIGDRGSLIGCYFGDVKVTRS